MGDVTSKQVTKAKRSETFPVKMTQREERNRCTCFGAESCHTTCPVKLLSYTSAEKSFEQAIDGYSANVTCEKDILTLSNEVTVKGINSKSSTATYAVGSINEAFIASSPESSPQSSAGSQGSYSFCDDSLLQLLKQYEDADGLNVSDFAQNWSYIHFPFSYPSLKELTTARIKVDYPHSLKDEKAICDLSLYSPSAGTDVLSREEIEISTMSDTCQGKEVYSSEVVSSSDDTNFTPLQGVLNTDEDPMNEWPWPDKFELTIMTNSTSAEEDISLSFLKRQDRRSSQAIRTIIIDSDRDLNLTEDNCISHVEDDCRDAIGGIASDLYDVIKELSPMPIRKSWSLFESAAKTSVKGLLLAEDFSLLNWTHKKVFPVA